MDKSNIYNAPLFIAIFLVLLLSMNYLNIDFDLDDMFEVKTIIEAKNALEKSKNEISNLQQEIVDSEGKIEALKHETENLILNNLEINSSISELAIVCGRTDVRGPGITIRVADNLSDDEYFDINYKIVHDFDVRIIINQLNSAGAEAIAVNGKRIVNTTEIICIGPVIRINGEAVAAPFIIKAIGDPDALMEVINSENSYAYEIKNDFGIDIKAMKNYDINIAKNYETKEVNFAKLYEEGE